LLRILMSSWLLGMVLSVCTYRFHNTRMVTLPSWLVYQFWYMLIPVFIIIMFMKD
jgi:hypothetical protein